MVIPAARYKTEVDMLIPLSDLAQQIIRQQPRWNSSDFVFSLTGNGPLRSISRFKKIFDEACGLKDYRTHDLRRTARTLMCSGNTARYRRTLSRACHRWRARHL